MSIVYASPEGGAAFLAVSVIYATPVIDRMLEDQAQKGGLLRSCSDRNKPHNALTAICAAPWPYATAKSGARRLRQ